MNYKNLLFILGCLSFSTIVGAAIYEHIALWPTAFSEVPKSLTSFQGAYKHDSSPFWMSIHPVTLLLLISSAIVNRKSERSKYIIIPLIAYIVILATTFTYFVPELMSLIHFPYADSIDTAATSRAHTWINLSLIRMVVLIAAAVMLYMGLTKPATRFARVTSH